jgi:membrane-associated phospholipid phosphatase
VHSGWWVWPLRLVLLAVIVLIGPSRMLEGEHWLSDVVAGYLYGAFWLILGLQVYGWAARRWPRLLAPGEQKRVTA